MIAMLRKSLSTRKLALGARSLSRWSNVTQGPKDPILGVTEAFKADTDPKKLNLGVGAYRDDNGQPWVLPSVYEASRRIVEMNLNNEYSPIIGDAEFVDLSLQLALGQDNVFQKEKRVAALQALSGTGALRVLGAFIQRFSDPKNLPTVYVPNPTWGNHHAIFRDCGLDTKTYSYYHPETRGLDLDGMLNDLRSADDNQVVILHAAAHNPTGVDPTHEQWAAISDVCKAKNHFVMFDSAYQGFASGDPERDAFSVRHFLKEGHKIALAQSFAKNLGLYGHRVGVASIITEDAEETERVMSQIKIISRAMYSNPPIHGARLVKIVLGDAELRKMWMGEVASMAGRINTMRSELRGHLEDIGSDLPWNHITDQIGMFCYSGLTPEQVEELKNDHHIYMTSNGRISMAGVSSKTVRYLAESIHAVTK